MLMLPSRNLFLVRATDGYAGNAVLYTVPPGPGISSTHLAPDIVITVLLTAFPYGILFILVTVL